MLLVLVLKINQTRSLNNIDIVILKYLIFHMTGLVLHLTKTSPAPDPQLHGRAQMAPRDPNTAQRVSPTLQRQRLCGQQYTHGKTRSAQARDCFLCLLMEHRRRRRKNGHVLLQPVLRRSRNTLWLRRDGRHSTLAKPQCLFRVIGHFEHDHKRTQCAAKENLVSTPKNRAPHTRQQTIMVRHVRVPANDHQVLAKLSKEQQDRL